MSEFEIIHQQDQQLFYIEFDDNEKAFIKYRLLERQKESAVDFYSTLVPTSQRGKGIAAKLVEKAFVWADQQQLRIEASCWYAAKKIAQRTTA